MEFHEVEHWVDPPGQAEPSIDPDFFLSFWQGNRNKKIRIKALNKDSAKSIAEYWIAKLHGETFELQRKINWSIGFSFYVTVGRWKEE